MRSSGASSLQEQVEDRPKVLLVDDDEVNLMLVSAALSKHGFDVTEAGSGDEALRILGGWIPIWWCWTPACRAWTASRPARNCAACTGWRTCPC
jgi:hypothetical protein